MSTSVLESSMQTENDVALPAASNDNELELNVHEATGKVALNYVTFRVCRGKLPQRKPLSTGRKARVAQQLGMSKQFLTLSKKLWNANEPAVKRVRKVFVAIDRLYSNREYTLPCPTETGTRLVKRGKVDELDRRMGQLRDELQQAARALKEELPAIVERLRASETGLGNQFDAADYDFDPEQECSVTWDFPPIHTADTSLAAVAPRVYEKQLEAIRRMYTEACKAKEQEMAEQMLLAIDSLVERLDGKADNGRQKILQERTVTKLFSALDHAEEQLRENGIGAGPLNEAFNVLRRSVDGRREGLAQQLKTGGEEFRKTVRDQFAQIGRQIEALAVVKPRRAILRKKLKSAALTEAA